MGIRFDEIDGFIKIHDKIRYLILSDYGWFDKVCDNIKYLISKESGITDSINHNFARIRIDCYNSYRKYIKKYFYNVIILLSKLLIRIKMNTTIIYF